MARRISEDPTGGSGNDCSPLLCSARIDAAGVTAGFGASSSNGASPDYWTYLGSSGPRLLDSRVVDILSRREDNFLRAEIEMAGHFAFYPFHKGESPPTI